MSRNSVDFDFFYLHVQRIVLLQTSSKEDHIPVMIMHSLGDCQQGTEDLDKQAFFWGIINDMPFRYIYIALIY